MLCSGKIGIFSPMVLNRRNSVSIVRHLYRGQTQTVILLKRGDDQKEGTVTALTLYGVRRGNISKTGEAISQDMSANVSCQWIIPASELRRVGVNYLNVIDRIVDVFGMYWQPESGQSLTLSQFDSQYIIECIRVDPTPNPNLILGIPAVGLPNPGS